MPSKLQLFQILIHPDCFCWIYNLANLSSANGLLTNKQYENIDIVLDQKQPLCTWILMDLVTRHSQLNPNSCHELEHVQSKPRYMSKLSFTSMIEQKYWTRYNTAVRISIPVFFLFLKLVTFPISLSWIAAIVTVYSNMNMQHRWKTVASCNKSWQKPPSLS